MGVIAEARKYAVDQILRATLEREPWPPHGAVILIDDPAHARVGIRFNFRGDVYHLYTNRLAFEELNERLIVTPVAPRRAPHYEPGVVYRVPASDLALDWMIEGDPAPRPRYGLRP